MKLLGYITLIVAHELVFVKEKEYFDTELGRNNKSRSAKFQRLRDIIAYKGNLRVHLQGRTLAHVTSLQKVYDTNCLPALSLIYLKQ